MRQLSKALLGFVFLVILFSFVKPPEWYVFETHDYSVEFPKMPDTSTQVVKSAIGDLKLNISMVDASKGGDDNLVYMTITSEYPDSLINSGKTAILPAFFRNSIDGAVKNVQGKLLSEKNIEIEGFPGREVRVDYQQGAAIIKMDFYLVHNEMIILQTITVPAKENNASESKFYHSLRLKRK